MKVLSLFDGISCGMVALERVGIFVERYVAKVGIVGEMKFKRMICFEEN